MSPIWLQKIRSLLPHPTRPSPSLSSQSAPIGTSTTLEESQTLEDLEDISTSDDIAITAETPPKTPKPSSPVLSIPETPTIPTLSTSPVSTPTSPTSIHLTQALSIPLAPRPSREIKLISVTGKPPPPSSDPPSRKPRRRPTGRRVKRGEKRMGFCGVALDVAAPPVPRVPPVPMPEEMRMEIDEGHHENEPPGLSDSEGSFEEIHPATALLSHPIRPYIAKSQKVEEDIYTEWADYYFDSKNFNAITLPKYT